MCSGTIRIPSRAVRIPSTTWLRHTTYRLVPNSPDSVWVQCLGQLRMVRDVTGRLCSSGSRGGSRGSGPPLLGHDVGFLTLGPKLDPLLDPPLFACRPKMDLVADPGCVCDRGDHPHPLGMRMTSHGQCPWGGVLVNVQEWGCFSIFLRADDVMRTMSKGGCLWKILYPRLDPPPLSKILEPPLLWKVLDSRPIRMVAGRLCMVSGWLQMVRDGSGRFRMAISMTHNNLSYTTREPQPSRSCGVWEFLGYVPVCVRFMVIFWNVPRHPSPRR